MTAIAKTTTQGEVIDQTRYELVQSIRRMGERVSRAITEMNDVANSAQVALHANERPLGGSYTPENPVELLRDMEPLLALARIVGIPEDAILTARRGGFVPISAYIARAK
jgi:hypothetical protein